MALSFLYAAFVRLLQLFRLCRSREELAVEVVMLRHEVSVLRREERPRYGQQTVRFSPG